MTEEELDQVRRLLLAFEDAAGWCEQLAEVARAADAGAADDQAARRNDEIRRVLQYLAADRESVARVRTRLGIPPLGTGPQLT